MLNFYIPCAGLPKKHLPSCSLSGKVTSIFLKIKEEEQIQREYYFFLSEIPFLFGVKRHYPCSALSMS